tara:strand:- start:176 stop:664 length:489 start_codon:yes stop_codon:yes gene_type:complete
MKYLSPLILILFIISPFFALSQNLSDKKNIVNLQIHPLGRSENGGIVEIDYERYLGGKNSWSVRIGIKPYLYLKSNGFLFLTPISIQKIFWSEKKNQFELGIGTGERFEFFNGNVYHFRYFPIVNLMYRNNLTERLHLRAGITGYITWGSSISPNFGLGYKF